MVMFALFNFVNGYFYSVGVHLSSYSKVHVVCQILLSGPSQKTHVHSCSRILVLWLLSYNFFSFFSSSVITYDLRINMPQNSLFEYLKVLWKGAGNATPVFRFSSLSLLLFSVADCTQESRRDWASLLYTRLYAAVTSGALQLRRE